MVKLHYSLTLFVVLTKLANTRPETQGHHPSLYFSKDDIPDMRRKASSSHAEIYARLQAAAKDISGSPTVYLPPKSWDKFASRWNEIYGNNLPPLAIYSLLHNTDVATLKLTISAMETLASYKSWRTKGSPEDDVPAAHSLVGLATAYDFLHSTLNKKQRDVIGKKIVKETKILYERSFKKWWGKAYVQNHVATNYVALFTGALVVRSLTPEAELWIARAHRMLNRTCFILGHVRDGSLTEGVAYGTYTTRSLFQYLFLASRHLNKTNYYDNVWLREHFWFLYWTILPRFNETIGIADSNTQWFYGPESQLVFLDNFVNRNGYGNWLASKIRKMRQRNRITAASSQKYTTLHTEFLFYDDTIPERDPSLASSEYDRENAKEKRRMVHRFDDWGVVVFRRYFQNNLDNKFKERRGHMDTYLSFKCGVLHGEAINRIVRTKSYPWIRGWRDFNAGHEHPDQGTFIFYPNGIPFITEDLYSPKYTWHNNALMFSPASSSLRTCAGTFAGQMGDCSQWIGFRGQKFWEGQAGILIAATDESNRYFYAAGEFSGRYDKSLGLQQVQRHLVLVQHDLLIVLDTVRMLRNSTVRKMSSFFHNRYNTFSIKTNRLGNMFTENHVEGAAHRIHWVCSSGKQSCVLDVQTQHDSYKAEFRTRSTNLINITSLIHPREENILAYVFSGPALEISGLKLRSENEAMRVSVMVNGISYDLRIKKEVNKQIHVGRFEKHVEIKIERSIMDSFCNEGSSCGKFKFSRLDAEKSILLFAFGVSGAILYLLKRRKRCFPTTRNARTMFSTVCVLMSSVMLFHCVLQIVRHNFQVM